MSQEHEKVDITMKDIDYGTLFRIGFWAGLGWSIADQLSWFAFDLIKELNGIPLG